MASTKRKSQLGYIFFLLFFAVLLGSIYYVGFLHPEHFFICCALVVAVFGLSVYFSEVYRKLIDIIFNFSWSGFILFVDYYLKSKNITGNNLIPWVIILFFLYIGTEIAIPMNYTHYKDSQRRTLRTQAVVIDYKSHTTTTGGEDNETTTTYYTALLKYEVNGVIYKNYSVSSNRSSPRIGSTRTIAVNPDDPDDYSDCDYTYNRKTFLRNIFAGIGMIVLGFIAVLIISCFSYSIDLREAFKGTALLDFLDITGIYEKLGQLMNR